MRASALLLVALAGPALALVPARYPVSAETLTQPTLLEGVLVAPGIVRFDERHQLEDFTLAADGLWLGFPLPAGTTIRNRSIALRAGALDLCGVHFSNGESASVSMHGTTVYGMTVGVTEVDGLSLRPGHVAVSCSPGEVREVVVGTLAAPGVVSGQSLSTGDSFVDSASTGLTVVFLTPRTLRGGQVGWANWIDGDLREVRAPQPCARIDGFPVAPASRVTFAADGSLWQLSLAEDAELQGLPIAAGGVAFSPTGVLLAGTVARECTFDGHRLAARSAFQRDGVTGALRRYVAVEGDAVRGHPIPAGALVVLGEDGGIGVVFATPKQVNGVLADGFTVDAGGVLRVNRRASVQPTVPASMHRSSAGVTPRPPVGDFPAQEPRNCPPDFTVTPAVGADNTAGRP